MKNNTRKKEIENCPHDWGYATFNKRAPNRYIQVCDKCIVLKTTTLTGKTAEIFHEGERLGIHEAISSTENFVNHMDTKPCVCSTDGKCEYNKGFAKAIFFIKNYLNEWEKPTVQGDPDEADRELDNITKEAEEINVDDVPL